MRITSWLAAGVIGCAISGAALAQNISIATGGTGGVYYPLGGGMAAALSKYVPGMQATAEVTGGSVANLQLIGTGKSYIGLSMVDAAQDALQGQGKFASGKVPVRTLMILYPNRMHVVTVEGSGINKITDLKGKRVSTGSPGSATEVMAFRVIEAAGLDKDKDMTRERLGVAESVNAVKDRKIDAFFWVGGLPTAGVTDLANTPGLTLKLVDHAELVGKMNQKYGNLYIEDAIPKSVYKGMAVDNHQATVMNILVHECEHGRRDGLQHRQDHLREARRPDRGAQGSRELQAREPEDQSDAAALPPGRTQVLRREGRQGRLNPV